MAEMVRARGLRLRGLVRDPASTRARHLAALGVELVVGDLGDRSALLRVARGANAFVHMAAEVGDRASRVRCEQVNVEGTRNAVVAAGEAGCHGFVQLSSVAAYGRTPGARVSETQPCRPSGMPYDDSKCAAEALAFQLGAARGMVVSAIRPPMIYGTHDRNFIPRLIATLRRHPPLLIDGGRAPCNMVWADHVIEVMLLAAARPELGCQAFNVVDDIDESPPSYREVMDIATRALGLPGPRWSLPRWAALVLAHALVQLHRVGGEAPPLTPWVVASLTHDVTYDAGKAVRLLGWRPHQRSRDGLADAIRTLVAAA